MNGGSAGGAGRFDDAFNLQIAVARRRRADPVGLIGHSDEHRVRIGVGIHRDGPDPEAFRRTDDAAGDLAAIRDQDAFEHGLSSSFDPSASSLS
jgi:hypothetical protein